MSEQGGTAHRGRSGIVGLTLTATGVVYGAFVSFAMQHAVLPLAAQFRSLYIPATKAFMPGFAWPQFGIHLMFVGLAISLAVKHTSRREA